VRKSFWIAAVGSLFFIVAAVIPATAQDKADVDIQYQFQRFSGAGDSTNMPLGFNFAVAGRFRPSLSAVGQVDWSRKSESVSGLGINAEATLNVTSFAGGIRWSGTTNPSATPFVQGLFGAAHHSSSASGSVAGVGGAEFSESGTDAMIDIGGGIAFPLSGNLGGVGQVDYRRIFTEGEGTNSIRVAVGIRWMKKS
jgi:Outer membrane protein beta-barrel domain